MCICAILSAVFEKRAVAMEESRREFPQLTKGGDSNSTIDKDDAYCCE